MAELYDASDELVNTWQDAELYDSALVFDSEFQDTVIEVGFNFGKDYHAASDDAIIYLAMRNDRGEYTLAGLTPKAGKQVIDAIQGVIDHYQVYTDD